MHYTVVILEYLKLADHFVFSPGGDNRNNYANVEEIVNHAVEKGVDAVWAGWGHASENPELPKQLAARGIVFIGPPCSAMFSLGDKIASTIIAQTLDIPTIEWSGSGLKLDLSDKKEGEHVTVTQELFNQATVSDLYEGLRALEEHKIGYPLMRNIKASEGGGGKGIRKCKNEADFKENFVQVQTEVPGSPIFLMKCVENARHIEVQLIADRLDQFICDMRILINYRTSTSHLICLGCLDRYGLTPLPDEQVLTDTEYSVIAARITSEDPEDFFRPSTGSVEVLNFRSAQNVWGYFSVSSAGKVHEFADSQFGHLFARGRTRYSLYFIQFICFIPRSCFCALYYDYRSHFLNILYSFFLIESEYIFLTHLFIVTVTRSGPLNFIISLNGSKTQVEIRLLGDGSLLVTHRERSYTCNLEETSDKFKVTIGRSIVIFEKDNDPTILKSPYTGKLLSYKKPNREWVAVGAVYASVESMKLVFNVEVKKAPGRLEHVAKEGDLLYPGSVIARLVDQKDSEKYKPKPYLEPFTEWSEATENDKNIPETKKYNMCYDRCMNILNGSIPLGAEFNMGDLVDELFSYLESPSLPHAMLKHSLNPMLNRIPDKFSSRIKNATNIDSMEKFSAIRSVLDDYFSSISHTEWETAKAVCNMVYHTCERCDRRGMHLVSVTPLTDNLREIGNMFHTDDVCNQSRHLLLQNSRVKYRKFLNKIIWDIEMVPILDRNMKEVLPVNDAVCKLRTLFEQMMQKGMSSKEMFEKSPWVHKVIHEFFFDEKLADFAIRAYIGLHFSVDDVTQSSLLCANHDAIVYDFCIDNSNLVYALIFIWMQNYFKYHVSYLTYAIFSHYIISPKTDSNHYLSIVKFSVNRDNFIQAMTNENLITSLVGKFAECGIKSNGIRSQLRVTLLVNIIQTAVCHVSKEGDREAQLEELPNQSDHDNTIVIEAEKASAVIRCALLEKLTTFDIITHVLVCNQNKPLMQIKDSLAFLLEKFLRFQLGQRKNGLFVNLLNRYYILPIYNENEIESTISAHLDSACGAMNVAMRKFKKYVFVEFVNISIHVIVFSCIFISFSLLTNSYCRNDDGLWNIYVSNHVFLYVTFPKLPVDFTSEYEEVLDDLFENSIKEQREILYKHHVTEVEIVYARVEKTENGRQLIKRRVKFLDETGVTPEFGIYDEQKVNSFMYYMDKVSFVSLLISLKAIIMPRKLSHLLYGKNLQGYSTIKKIEKKRASTRANGTTYVYDYPTLIGRACLEEWKKLEEKVESFAHTSEQNLFIKQFCQLSEIQRAAYYNGDYHQFFTEEELVVKRRADNCNNETGVVAWQLRFVIISYKQEHLFYLISLPILSDSLLQRNHLDTPSFRELMFLPILVHGSVWQMMSQRFSGRNLRCYFYNIRKSADDTYIAKFTVQQDPDRPDEGFEYLYVDGSDEQLLKDQIVYDKMPNGQLKLKAVVGKEVFLLFLCIFKFKDCFYLESVILYQSENIGVENLQGSGLIAGETSAAYDEVPTYCFVTGRTVGIGAYTARLAHRIVQARSSHIILTGAPALNTLLGKEVNTLILLYYLRLINVYTSNNQLGGVQIMFKNGVTHAVVNDDFEGICKIVQWMSYLPCEDSSFPYRQTFGLDSKPRLVQFDIEPNKPYDIRQLIDSGKSTDGKGICDCNSFDEIMNDWAKTIIAGRARISGIPIGVVSSELRNVKSINPADPASPNSQSVEVHQAGQVSNYPHIKLSWKVNSLTLNEKNRFGIPILLKKYFKRILEPNAIVGIKFRGDKLLALQKRNDEIMKRLDEELIVEIRVSITTLMQSIAILYIRLFVIENGIDSDRSSNLRRLLTKRSEDLKKAYRGVTVELADLHDRPERMSIKKAVQVSIAHVTDLADSRNLFTQIFTLETAKVHLCEMLVIVKSDLFLFDIKHHLYDEYFIDIF
uniref:Acetyl-CoA carboxylase n=1 Tax=Heterorhabditis bacteriophora TaxID=37862 RepID=A0A1I7WUC5_HETBA